MAELDAWDEPNFARYGAALRRRFPSAYAYVFRDLKASTGSDAVAGVATFLARIKTLAEGSDPARSASVKDDAKAIALLETRGLEAKERKRLDALVKLALGPTESLDALPTEDPADERLAKLAQLKGWYDEWAATARAVVSGDLGTAPGLRAWISRVRIFSTPLTALDTPGSMSGMRTLWENHSSYCATSPDRAGKRSRRLC